MRRSRSTAPPWQTMLWLNGWRPVNIVVCAGVVGIPGAKALAKSPERLSQSLELFFRIESLDKMLGSVEDGARKYQGPAVAQEVETVYAEGGANRERFRRYIVNLAAERERQFEVMDKEAQRCRAGLMAAPPPKTSGRKK